MERFFCFGKKDFCKNDDECFGCEFETGDGGIAESKLSAIFEKFLGENYDLDRLRDLANQRMTMREDVAQRVQITKGIDLDRLRELVEADRAGRCVILLCKTGDTVYVIGAKKIVKAQIQEIYFDDAPDIIYLVDFECDNDCDGCPFNSWEQSWEGEWECDGKWGDGSIKQSEFGKTVFLTREAAEAALKGDQDGKNNVSPSDHF